MNNSDNKRLSLSSTPKKRPQTPKDENEKSYQEMGPNLQSSTPKKSVKKHYMSPTISAASKVILPKRKVLGENNQTFDNHYLPKTPNIRASQESLSQKTPSRCSDLEETEQNYAVVSDSASKPYDPVRNYLSPRPQFLRYRPIRCREILRLSENEKIESSDVSCISKSFSFEPKKEDGEENVFVAAQTAPNCEEALIGSSVDNSIAEKEGVLDDKEASIGKEMALEASNSSSIDYSTVEQTDPVDSQKTLIDDSVAGLMNQLQDSSVGAQEDSSGFSTDSSLKQEDEQFEEEEEDEFEETEKSRGWGFTGVFKFLLLLAAVVFSTSYISTMNSASPEFSSQAIKTFEDQYFSIKHGVSQFMTSFKDVRQPFGEAVGPIDEGIGQEEENPQMGENEDLQIFDAEKNCEFDWLNELAEQQSGENEVSESRAEEIDQQSGENEVSESYAAEIDLVCDNEMVERNLIFDEVAIERLESSPESQIPNGFVGTLENKVVMERIEETSSVETDQADNHILESEIFMSPIEIVNDADIDRVNPEPTPNSKGRTVLTLCAIVAGFVFGLHFMKKKKDSSMVAEKSKSILQNEDKTRISTYSFAKCRSIINSLQKEENRTESYESYTGGDDVSSSMRSQSYSQPAPSDCSYGSFTTEERIFRKRKDKRDGDGYSEEITITPVRRSSRLLNRAIVSPRKLQYR